MDDPFVKPKTSVVPAGINSQFTWLAAACMDKANYTFSFNFFHKGYNLGSIHTECVNTYIRYQKSIYFNRSKKWNLHKFFPAQYGVHKCKSRKSRNSQLKLVFQTKFSDLKK